MTADLSHVATWVFDLDNTLYPSDAAVMAQVDAKMTDYVARLLDLDRDQARKVQKDYWREYGTTLNGLMANHQIPDGRDFLDFVHDVDLSVVTPDPALAQHIKELPGRRLVYTNGSMKHAENVCTRLGLSDCFDDMFDVEAAGFQPKPHLAGFDRFSRRFGIEAPESAFFEDSIRNLKTAYDLGWTTILVRARPGPRDEESAGPDEHPAHVHYAADCLKTFLSTAQTKDRAA
ncbi:pyrimidine 5'-nucleotidase [Hyphobacterium sp.]|jgi:putative hydrolase of the HAD superfamily|uniref:pyrimidine 5'-nucleotidase n=1 Tax=Hyphobacterium sp. TaxID=2004662 RepID=UPI003BAA9B07